MQSLDLQLFAQLFLHSIVRNHRAIVDLNLIIKNSPLGLVPSNLKYQVSCASRRPIDIGVCKL